MPKQLSTINSLILSTAFSRRRSSGIVLDQLQQVDVNACRESDSTNEHDCEINSKSHKKKSLVKLRTESSHRDIDSSNTKYHVTTLGTIKIVEKIEL